MKRAAHRFYLAVEIQAEEKYSVTGATVTLSLEESHHLSRVLRLGKGGVVEIFDASGADYEAEVADAGGRQRPATLRIVRQIPSTDVDENLAVPEVHIAIAIIKHRAMDWLIEKLSELGVTSIQPLITERTVAADRAASESPERWTRLAIAAAKQCGRNRPLRIARPLLLADWIAEENIRNEKKAGADNQKAFAHFKEGAPTIGEWKSKIASLDSPITLGIGCEGGWSDAEAEELIASGFQVINLGRLTLRAETAAMAGAAILIIG